MPIVPALSATVRTVSGGTNPDEFFERTAGNNGDVRLQVEEREEEECALSQSGTQGRHQQVG